MKVCILSAGKGTRMGPLTLYTNKGLLPFKKKAIISHIIDSFPSNYSFVVAVGYKADHIRQYLKIAHPKTKIEFAVVENYAQKGSGPGLSLLQCKEFLQEPFYVVCGDTLWDSQLENIDATPSNWLGASIISPETTQNFCTLGVTNDGNIDQIYDKDPKSPSQMAFNGLFFISNFQLFFASLANCQTIQGEHQISNGFEQLITNKSLKTKLISSWLDLGNSQNYMEANKNCPQFVFRKNNEYFYDFNNRIIKFFANEQIVNARSKRQKKLSNITPKLQSADKNFYAYEKLEGSVLYDNLSLEIVKNLLEWLDQNLWKQSQPNKKEFDENCRLFYQNKTLDRVTAYFKRFPTTEGQKNVLNILSTIDWDFLAEGYPVSFHGDLQFDNIIYHQGSFQLIDWRQDFAGSLTDGDIYYDLAKLKMGIDIHLQNLKLKKTSNNENFSPRLTPVENHKQYLQLLEDYCSSKNLNYQKVELISYLILLNMAPLHSEELAKALWDQGLLRLKKALEIYPKLTTIKPLKKLPTSL